MTTLARYYRELATGERRRPLDRLLLLVLMLPSLGYGWVMTLRARLYEAGVLRSYRLSRPVVAVGNLTVGGTGKTPMVALVARHYLARGKRVAVLSRGYGGTLHGRGEHVVSDGNDIRLTALEAGDEPYLLAESVPGLAVVIGADRYRAALLANDAVQPDIFLLDDGFQHLRLRRDLNILLLDSRRPFGNGSVFPAGLLREPVSAARRADLVVYTRMEGGTPDLVPGIPSCRARHRLTGFAPLGGAETLPFSELEGRGLAFAGIADPDAFFASLEREGVTLAATIPLDDHCAYSDGEVESLCREAERCGADFFITTAKDAVKLAHRRERLLPLYAAKLEMAVADRETLERALDKQI